jgi:putative ABC transport system permease protein
MSAGQQRSELHEPRQPRTTAGWRLLAGTGTGASAALGLLVLAAVFVAMAIPRASLSQRTHALQQTFSQLPAAARTVTATIDYESFTQSVGGGSPQDQLASTRSLLAQQLTSAHVPIDSRTAWTSLSTGPLTTAGAAQRAYYGTTPPVFQLVYRDALRGYARLQSGTWPAAATEQHGTTAFQAVITPATAARFELHIGSRLGVGPGVYVIVTGIVRPTAPGSAFWTEFASVLTPTFTATQFSGYWTGAAFVGSGETSALVSSNASAADQVSWVYPLNLSGVGAGQASALIQDINNAGSQVESMLTAAGDTSVGLGISSGITPVVTSFVTTENAVDGILSLLFASLTVLGVVVLLLCTQLVADRRGDEFAIMRARGATRWQLGLLVLRGGLLIALPSAAIAVLLAILLTPGGGNALSWWLAGVTTLTALIGPAMLAARRDPAERRGRNRGAAAARRVRVTRRLVVELTLTGVAVAGLVVLRQQGLSSAGSVNALASAGPVLVAVPAAIIMVRLCPLVLGWLQRLARRGRGLVAYMGLARGAERAAGALLPVFALVLALAVVTFGGTVQAAVNRGEQAAAWQLAGGDAMVGSPTVTIAVTPAAQRAIAAVRGVQRVAGVQEQAGLAGLYAQGGSSFNVAVVDPGQYAALLARTPAPPFPAQALARPAGPSGVVPVLASPDAAASLRAAGYVATINGTEFHVSVRGLLASTPAAPPGAPFVVLPLWAVPNPLPPNVLLLSGPHIDRAALTAVVARTAPAVPVTFQSVVQANLAAAPLPRSGYEAYAQGSAAAAIFSLIVVLISLLLGARARELTDARLSTMGVDAWQARRVGIVEAVPFILAAAAGGAVAAAVLVPLIAPTLDLSVFTGTPGSVYLAPDVLTLAIGAAVLVVLAMAVIVGQAAAAQRRGVGRALRVGE